MRVIEFDCDGVLLDLGTAVVNSDYGRLMQEQGLTFEQATHYDFRNFNKEVKRQIFASFSDIAVISAVRPYDGVISMLVSLNIVLGDMPEISILLRTGITSEKVRVIKQAKLEKLLTDSVGIFNPNFDIEIINTTELGTDKPDISPFILVEDNPERLILSKAQHKILVNHGYNQESAYPELKGIDYIRVTRYTDIVEAIKAILIKSNGDVNDE